MKKTSYLIICFAFLLFPRISYATSPVLLNEFVVDQSPQAVELMNFGTEPADISNWYIDDNGGTTFYTIPANTVISPNSCMVFASEFNLNKSSADMVRLFDATAVPTSPSAHLIDSFAYSSGPGGLLSFSREPDGNNWATASATLGKYNSTGQSCILIPSPTPTLTPTPTVFPTITSFPSPTTSPNINISPTPSLEAIQNIFISEVMANPDTGDHEWVELYNDNVFEVNLSNWYIDDEENAGAAPKQFSITIPAKGYVSYELSSSIFNNDADSARLLDQNKVVVDSMQYSVAEKNRTIGRTDFTSDTFCMQESSKNASNSPCLFLNEYITPIATPSASPVQSKKPISLVSLLSTGRDDSQPGVTITPRPTPVYKTYSLPFINTTISNKTSSVESDKEVLIPSRTKEVNSLQIMLKSFTLSSGSFSLLGCLSLLLKLKLHQ